MKSQNGFVAAQLLFVMIFLFGFVGYALNIYKLTQCDFEPSYKAEIIRAVGIFPPVGAIVGYLNFGE